MKRTQIYLDEKQAARLDERAAEGGTTRSKMIREAIDAYLTPDGDEWRARWKEALRATGGIAPYLPEDHVDGMR
ncbi:MAG: CopG family transcriptional regulator, partial [Pseudonocardiaceae bacterium]